MWEHLPKLIVASRHPLCLHNLGNDAALRQGVANKVSPLTEVGVMQRDITAEYLKKEFGIFDKVLCTTYDRTRTIPEAAGMSAQLLVEPRLDERSMGVWHQFPREVVYEKYPEERGKLAEIGYFDYKAPGGENCADVDLRLLNLLDDKQLWEGNGTAYLSGHGIAGLCLKRILLKASFDEMKSWEHFKNASVTVYKRHGDEFTCVMHNYAPWEGHIDPELLRKPSTEA